MPGAAERIFRMAEREQAHRIEQERTAVQASIAGSMRGQWFGAAIAIAAVGGAIANVVLHGPWQATVALVGVPVLGIIRTFVHSHDSNPRG